MVTRAPICFTISFQAQSEMYTWNGPKCTHGNTCLVVKMPSPALTH